MDRKRGISWYFSMGRVARMVSGLSNPGIEVHRRWARSTTTRMSSPMGNYVIGLGNYVIVSPSDLGDYVKAADTAPRLPYGQSGLQTRW